MLLVQRRELTAQLKQILYVIYAQQTKCKTTGPTGRADSDYTYISALYLRARPWYGLLGRAPDSAASVLLEIAKAVLGTTFLHYTYEPDHGMVCWDRAGRLIRRRLSC
jgi:hypothetical protein